MKLPLLTHISINLSACLYVISGNCYCKGRTLEGVITTLLGSAVALIGNILAYQKGRRDK